MNLIDSVAQFRTPFVVGERARGKMTALNNAADCAALVAQCPLRYVLTDEVTRLCADLAYSRGARTVACADLLRAPAEKLWVEWRQGPWQRALQQYGFVTARADSPWVGRRGIWVRSSPDGRRGLMRTFWSVGADDVLASNVEAYFDFDTPAGEEPEPFDRAEGAAARVEYGGRSDDDTLGRCFRFRYERSWSQYYGAAVLSPAQRAAVWQHAVSTVALDIPVLLAFFLLLATRTGLPQRAQTFGHLNRRRLRSGKPPLLEHIEVRVPVLTEHRHGPQDEPHAMRMSPRLHHVRGHLVRRGSQLFWRVPHLRGSARYGTVRSRTVTWSFDSDPGPAQGVADEESSNRYRNVRSSSRPGSL